MADVIEPTSLRTPVSCDPDDDAVLALALAAQVDAVISGDNDLLSLVAFSGIPIMSVAAAVGLLETTK